jgi:hypothetical protein
MINLTQMKLLSLEQKAMNRILLVIDQTGVHREALEFACYLSCLTKSKLTALFLGDQKAQLSPQVGRKNLCSSHKIKEPLQNIDILETSELEERKVEFNRFVRNHSVCCNPDLKEVKTPEDILLETRFSDLILINGDTTFSDDNYSIPSDLVTFLLKKTECPVLITPLVFREISEIVFAYDGSPSSAYAIKEFTHLFPQFHDKKAVFLQVNEHLSSSQIAHEAEITEYLKMHYLHFQYQVLRGSPEDELFSYFLTRTNLLVVMGAFGKSIIQSMFQRSTADLLLKTTSLPIFITHK